ncbi:MAG: HPr family phosphocarrier protein [Planctomycetes bacterium]|nr:HPr family phosphocarrier protein [Planctomycetota bacterium]NOG56014.1 HPr family phosphocarrier protein [Planctomycetota bacterium]
MSQLLKRTVVISNRLGLHARPVMTFVELASTFECRITVRGRNQEVDGKSTLLMMTLGATRGTELEIEADGPDAKQALDSLAELVDRGFDE